MTLSGQNTEIYKGDDKVLEVAITKSDGSVQDLTSCSVNYVVYKHTTGGIVITKTTASGISLTNPTGGIFEISLIPSDTENLPVGYYFHEGELTDSTGKISTLFTGKFTIIDSKA